jgi:peptidoglycan/xylan/chitin deacetylase (PgdA/CDA1 family)
VFERLSSQLFLGSAQLKLFRQGMPVFIYHSIGDAPPGISDPFSYVSKSKFAKQLEKIVEHGFNSGSLDQLPQSGNPDKKVVVTFDDGYRNVLRNALDTLVRHRFSAVQYIVADLIGRQNDWDVKHGDVPERLMDASEIREWLAAGQQIGSHSLTHRNLKKLAAPEAREQIMGSKKKLEDTFGVAIRHFAYPGGKWTPMIRDLIQEAGYLTACTTRFGVNSTQTPRFELKRVFCLSESEMFGKLKHRIARRLGAA